MRYFTWYNPFVGVSLAINYCSLSKVIFFSLFANVYTIAKAPPYRYIEIKSNSMRIAFFSIAIRKWTSLLVCMQSWKKKEESTYKISGLSRQQYLFKYLLKCFICDLFPAPISTPFSAPEIKKRIRKFSEKCRPILENLYSKIYMYIYIYMLGHKVVKFRSQFHSLHIMFQRSDPSKVLCISALQSKFFALINTDGNLKY